MPESPALLEFTRRPTMNRSGPSVSGLLESSPITFQVIRRSGSAAASTPLQSTVEKPSVSKCV